MPGLHFDKEFFQRERILFQLHSTQLTRELETVRPRLHNTTCCQTRCQTGCQTRLTTGWMFVHTIQPVDNRLYRVNGVLRYTVYLVVCRVLFASGRCELERGLSILVRALTVTRNVIFKFFTTGLKRNVYTVYICIYYIVYLYHVVV